MKYNGVPKAKINVVIPQPEEKKNNQDTKSSANLKEQTSPAVSVSTSGADSGTLKSQQGGRNAVGHGASPAGFMAASKNVKTASEEGGLKNYTMDEVNILKDAC